MFTKKLVAVTAMVMALTMIPTVPASAASAISGAAITVKSENNIKDTYTPVNAKKLTSSYKKKLKKQRKNTIKVSKGNYKTRVKKEQKALIDITWEQLKANSQVKISEKSFDLMCRVVQCEAGNVKYSTKEMTAEVIVNRARSYKKSSDQISKALNAKNQFTVVKSSRINKVDINGETVNACKDALIRNSHPKNLKFFRAGYYFSWAKPYKHSDGTYFSLA